MIKRLIDIFGSLLGILLSSPLLIALALAVKITPGPVIYKGLRAGKGGKQFHMYKFRSMVQNADKIGGPSTAGDDPRLTGAGRFMRKFQLDELPQFFNVFKGEMSLVGPRPEVPSEVERYTEEQKRILSVKPGMTDWASLWNFHEEEILRGAADPHRAFREKIQPEKLRLALQYVDEQSLATDMKIILLTIKKLVS